MHSNWDYLVGFDGFVRAHLPGDAERQTDLGKRGHGCRGSGRRVHRRRDTCRSLPEDERAQISLRGRGIVYCRSLLVLYIELDLSVRRRDDPCLHGRLWVLRSTGAVTCLRRTRSLRRSCGEVDLEESYRFRCPLRLRFK